MPEYKHIEPRHVEPEPMDYWDWREVYMELHEANNRLLAVSKRLMLAANSPAEVEKLSTIAVLMYSLLNVAEFMVEELGKLYGNGGYDA